jgi:iron uptake system EfeUOB component EfeO/EfeM
MKIINTIAALAMTSTLALAGCSSSNSSTSSTSSTADKNTNQTTSTQTSSKEQTIAPNLKDGVSKLLTTTDELKQAINAGDESKVKEIGPKLEGIWKTFEDGVKPKYPNLYEQTEKYLDPEVAGSQVTPLDKKTLGNLNNQLTLTLHELEKKAKE